MASIKPRFKIKVYEPIGVDLFFAFPEIQDNPRSFLDADSLVSVTSLSANGTDFAANDYLVLGQIGYEKTEIVKVSTVSATTITLASATQFPHSRGESLRLIPYNQIVPERSTDTGANYSALSAISLRADALETYLQRSSDTSTDYYKFRFFNATTGLYSGYSDAVVGTGYADSSLYSIKKRALDSLGEEKGDLITDEFLNEALREGRRIVDMDTRILRWSFRTSFNTDIGNVIPGQWSVSAPTTLRDRNTNKNILSLRIGRQNRPLVYQDNLRFRQNYLNVAHSTLNGAITTGSTSIILTASGDFDESGTVYVAGTSVSETNDAVAYTANTESTQTLSGVTGIGTNKASGTDVWQQATFGLPRAYTIVDGTIYFDVPFADEFAGENIYMDYYKSITELSTDNQELDEPFYDLYIPFLRYKIKYLKKNGDIDIKTDSDYLEFTQRVTQLIGQELQSQYIRFYPSINGGLGDF